MVDLKVKSYKIGEHCFGPVLEVNGKDFDDLDEYKVVDFISKMCFEHPNLMREVLQISLGYLQFDLVEESHHTCNSCGNMNYVETYTEYDDDDDDDDDEGLDTI